MLRRFRRKDSSALKTKVHSTTGATVAVEPQSFTTLKGPSTTVRRLVFIPGHDLLLASCTHSDDYLFDFDCVALPLNLLPECSDSYAARGDVVHICAGIVASVASHSGKITTWQATTRQLVATFKIPRKWCTKGVGRCNMLCAKLSDKQFVAVCGRGHAFVIGHVRGAQLKVAHEFHIEDRESIHRWCLQDVAAHGNMLVVCNSSSLSILDINSSFSELHTFPETWDTKSIAVGANRIFRGRVNGELVVYRNTCDFPIEFVLHVKVGTVNSIVSLTNDIVGCVGSNGCISFVSTSSRSVLYLMKLSQYQLKCAVLMGDGRIAVGGANGFCCSFFVPSPLLDVVEEFAAHLHPHSVLGLRLHPLRSAWLLVQEKSVSVYDACRNINISDTGPFSLEEWFYGHYLLMQAVCDGAVPSSRDFEGQQSHWLKVLYRHCPKLAMGEKDIGMVLAMFREAEDAGVIGEADVIVHSIETRRDVLENIVKGQRFMVNAIWDLFIHQAEQDATLQELLQWKRVQQLTGLVSALLSCVPFCGSIMTTAVTASLAVLNEINLHELVEALIEVTKDTGGGLMIDNMVNNFVKHSNVLLSEEEWEKVPERMREYVESAAAALGMSIEELRYQFLQAADSDTFTNTDGMPGTMVIVDPKESKKVGGARVTHPSPLRSLSPESSQFSSETSVRRSISKTLTPEARILKEQIREELRLETEAQLEAMQVQLTLQFREELEKMRSEFKREMQAEPETRRNSS